MLYWLFQSAQPSFSSVEQIFDLKIIIGISQNIAGQTN